MNITIREDFKKLIPPLTHDEYAGLEADIIANGCRDALVVWDGVLVDGHNRYEICTRHGIPFRTVEMSFENENDAKIWMIDNQISRRNLESFQIVEMRLMKKPLWAAKAKENQGTRNDILMNSSKCSEPINTRKQIAQESGVSEQTVQRVEKILQSAPTEIVEKARLGEISINQAYKELQKQKKMQAREAIEVHEPVVMDGLYDVIICDPPWKYDFAETESRAIENHYPTMTLDEMKVINVPSSDNCVMYMWATAPKLVEAIELLKCWGFEYKTCAVWDKQLIGSGYWFRGQHEMILVGVKGKFSPPQAELRESSVYSERRTGHSVKPKHYHYMIEKWFPDAKLLEMFAREKLNERWDVWGNMV